MIEFIDEIWDEQRWCHDVWMPKRVRDAIDEQREYVQTWKWPIWDPNKQVMEWPEEPDWLKSWPEKEAEVRKPALAHWSDRHTVNPTYTEPKPLPAGTPLSKRWARKGL